MYHNLQIVAATRKLYILDTLPPFNRYYFDYIDFLLHSWSILNASTVIVYNQLSWASIDDILYSRVFNNCDFKITLFYVTNSYGTGELKLDWRL